MKGINEAAVTAVELHRLFSYFKVLSTKLRKVLCFTFHFIPFYFNFSLLLLSDDFLFVFLCFNLLFCVSVLFTILTKCFTIAEFLRKIIPLSPNLPSLHFWTIKRNIEKHSNNCNNFKLQSNLLCKLIRMFNFRFHVKFFNLNSYICYYYFSS